MGAEPPWSSGRESRGDRLEIGPLWRFLSPISFTSKEMGSRRSAKNSRPVPVPAAAGNPPPLYVFAARLCLSLPRPVASGGPLSLFRTKKEAKEMRQREPIPKAVPFGILPHRPGGCGPLEIPRGLRRTRDEECETKDGRNGLPHPLCGFTMTGDEGRKTKDEGRKTGAWTGDTDCHTRYAGSQ